MNIDPEDELVPRPTPPRRTGPPPMPVSQRQSIERILQEWGCGARRSSAPLITLPGSATPWQDRWNTLWKELIDAQYDEGNQFERARQVSELAAQIDGSPTLEQQEEYSKLRQQGIPPVIVPAGSSVWAICTSVGLMLLVARPDELARAMEDPACVAMVGIPSGLMAITQIEAAIQLAPEQGRFWAWAAHQCGVLYGVGV